ncbi:MAG: PDZ domain-containing protein [Planctomycetes bacterium]|nr:PDZ domain-containing protein [Planctomycetota bacterium]
MSRFGLLASLGILLSPYFALAQSTQPDSSASLGLKLAPVPEALYAQMPELPNGKGILIDKIDSEHAAFRGGLRRHDIVTRAAGKPVQDSTELLHNLGRVQAGQILELTLFRAGKEKTLPFTIPRPDEKGLNAFTAPKSFLKPGGPPAVSVQCQPMDNGKLDVTILYYVNNSAKLDRLNFTGAINDIETQFQSHAREQQLPERVVDLVDVALRRLREINQNAK